MGGTLFRRAGDPVAGHCLSADRRDRKHAGELLAFTGERSTPLPTARTACGTRGAKDIGLSSRSAAQTFSCSLSAEVHKMLFEPTRSRTERTPLKTAGDTAVSCMMGVTIKLTSKDWPIYIRPAVIPRHRAGGLASIFRALMRLVRGCQSSRNPRSPGLPESTHAGQAASLRTSQTSNARSAGITVTLRPKYRTLKCVRCRQGSPEHAAAITVSAAGIKGLSAAGPGGHLLFVIPNFVEFEFRRFLRLPMFIPPHRAHHQPPASHLGGIPFGHHIRSRPQNQMNVIRQHRKSQHINRKDPCQFFER